MVFFIFWNSRVPPGLEKFRTGVRQSGKSSGLVRGNSGLVRKNSGLGWGQKNMLRTGPGKFRTGPGNSGLVRENPGLSINITLGNTLGKRKYRGNTLGITLGKNRNLGDHHGNTQGNKPG